jgi:hypothetical protein
MVVAVEAPDFISGWDLRDRLTRFQARALSGGSGETLVVVENPRSTATVLTIVHEWVQKWNVSQVEIRLGPKTYVMQRPEETGIGWRSSDEVEDLLDLEPLE